MILSLEAEKFLLRAGAVPESEEVAHMVMPEEMLLFPEGLWQLQV